MGTLLLLALGAWALFGNKDSNDGATIKSVPAGPPLPPLPVFTTDDVFPEHAKDDVVPEPKKEAPEEVPPSPGTAAAQQAPGEVVHEVVTASPAPAAGPGPVPAVEEHHEEPDMVSTPHDAVAEPVPVAPSPAVQEATAAPGVVVSEVVQSKRSPEQAARDLASYASQALADKHGALLGTKAAPSPFVRQAQDDMGITADGIYGPGTRARGEKLGVKMPVRR